MLHILFSDIFAERRKGEGTGFFWEERGSIFFLGWADGEEEGEGG